MSDFCHFIFPSFTRIPLALPFTSLPKPRGPLYREPALVLYRKMLSYKPLHTIILLIKASVEGITVYISQFSNQRQLWICSCTLILKSAVSQIIYT